MLRKVFSALHRISFYREIMQHSRLPSTLSPSRHDLRTQPRLEYINASKGNQNIEQAKKKRKIIGKKTRKARLPLLCRKSPSRYQDALEGQNHLSCVLGSTLLSFIFFSSFLLLLKFEDIACRLLTPHERKKERKKVDVILQLQCISFVTTISISCCKDDI